MTMTTSFEPEWRSKPLNERLAYVYTLKLFTDVDITVYLCGKDHVFKAHKSILAHFSPVLEKRFYGNRKKIVSLIRLEGLDPQGLSYVLKHLYHVPTIPQNDRSIILSSYHVAKQLDVRRVELELSKEIHQNLLTQSLITKNDFWKLLELSRILKLDDVLQELLIFAQNNAKELLRSMSLVKASAGTVKQVIDLDILNTPEIEVLYSVIRWKAANSRTPFQKDFVRDLLQCVRFRNFSPNDISVFIANKTDAITKYDLFRIRQHITNPAMKPLPPWCSTKFRRPFSSFSKDSVKVEKELAPKGKHATPNSPATNLLEMFTGQKHVDVCFMVGEERIPVKAHRNVLAMGSIVFATMFFGPLPDYRYDIAVSTENPEAFREMIRYFYDDSKLDTQLQENPEFASKIFDVALKYGSSELKNICKLHMDTTDQELKEFWKKLAQESEQKHAPTINESLKELLDYASKHTKEIFEGIYFLSAELDAIVSVLNLDYLGVKEIFLLYKTAEWLEHNPKAAESDEEKYKLLKCIRFDYIDPQKFTTFLTRHRNIFKEEESLAILMHLLNKYSPLPAWCYQGPPRDGSVSVSYQNIKSYELPISADPFHQTYWRHPPPL